MLQDENNRARQPYGTLEQIINLEDIWVNSNSNTLYIVLELMECNLERIFSSGHVLTAVHTKVLVKQLLLGVQAMHRHGILREGTASQDVYTAVISLCTVLIRPASLCKVWRRELGYNPTWHDMVVVR